ncbi:MAG: FmdB family zinc ribbon protein [Leptospirillum sp.]
MPNYEYFCTNCSSSILLIRSVSHRDDEVTCPHCLHSGKGSRILTACTVKKGGDARFSPRNLSEQLAGPGVVSPQGNGRKSVLSHQGCNCQ